MKRSIAALALGGLLLLLACGGDGTGSSPGVGGDGGGGSGGSGSGGSGGSGGGGSGGSGGAGGTGGGGGSGGEGGTVGEGGTGGVTAETGAIEGLVYVEGDGEPTGALVRYTGPEGSSGETTADATGSFHFAELAPGEYRLEARLAAYWPGTATVQVARSRISRASMRLGQRVHVATGSILNYALSLRSPAGDRLVFRANGSAPLLIAWDDVAGQVLTLPFSGWQLNAWGGTFSPDGRYAAIYLGETAPTLEGTVVDFETRALLPLGEDHAFRFTPDSRWLVTWNGNGGRVSARNLGEGRSVVPCEDYSQLVFSPVGPLLCRDPTAGWIRWDPADESREAIGAVGTEPLATSAALDRGLFSGPAADGVASHRSLRLWRRGLPLVPVAESMASYRLVDDIALWIDEGPTGDAGSLVRVNLASAEVEVLGTGIDAYLPAAGGQQLYALGDLPGWEPGDSPVPWGVAAPLSSWELAGGTWTEVAETSLYAYNGAPAVVSAWPAFGLFLAPGPGGGAPTLHVHRFADGTTSAVATGARFAEVRPQAVAYLHDETAATRSLSVIFADGTAPVPVLVGENLITQDEPGCMGPRFSASLERALLTVDCANGQGQLLVWDRILGLRRLGTGNWLGIDESGWPGPDPEADRIPYRRVAAAGDPQGELHVFDPVAFVDRTVAGAVLEGTRASAETVAFPAPAADGTRDAFVHDLATGLTFQVATGLPPWFQLEVNLGVPGAVAVLVAEDSSLPWFQEVRIRPPGAPEAFPLFRRVYTGSWPGLILPAAGVPRYWVQLDETDSRVGRLVLVSLPDFEVTTIADGVSFDLLVDPASRRIAYFLGGPADGGRPLYVTGLDEPAPLHVADGVSGAHLTTGAVIYEIEEGGSAQIYALRLP